MRRVRYVVDEILKLFPKSGNNDIKYVAIKTMMYESLKDLARVPDELIITMSKDISNALGFIAEGDMDELEEALRNAGNQ